MTIYFNNELLKQCFVCLRNINLLHATHFQFIFVIAQHFLITGQNFRILIIAQLSVIAIKSEFFNDCSSTIKAECDSIDKVDSIYTACLFLFFYFL